MMGAARDLPLVLFRPFLEAVETHRFAGLLTYFRNGRLPDIPCQWPSNVLPFYEVYSSGTVRDSHPVPF